MIFRFLLYVALVVGVTPLHSADVIIGTGSKSGVYFQAGPALCRLIKRNLKGTSCTALETAGSVSNLINVQGGALELGLVQSDLQFHATHNSGPFEFVDTPYDSLRSVFSLYTEPFTLVTRRDAKIESLDDLLGKRVNIGNPGSGQRATMEVVMAAKGWTKDDFKLASELKSAEQSAALCDNKVDVVCALFQVPQFSGRWNDTLARKIEKGLRFDRHPVDHRPRVHRSNPKPLPANKHLRPNHLCYFDTAQGKRFDHVVHCPRDLFPRTPRVGWIKRCYDK